MLLFFSTACVCVRVCMCLCLCKLKWLGNCWWTWGCGLVSEFMYLCFLFHMILLSWIICTARSRLKILKILIMYDSKSYVKMQMTAFSGSNKALKKMIRKMWVAWHVPFRCSWSLILNDGNFQVDPGMNVSFISHQPSKIGQLSLPKPCGFLQVTQ